MNKLIIAAVASLATLGAAAHAVKPTNLRQLNQERRIDAGKRSGKLTHAEAARLKQEQREIAQLTARLKARHGGKLTAWDKKLIKQRQDAANAHILQQKHDAQRGPNKLKI